MRRLFGISGILFYCSALIAQTPVGIWSDHLNYSIAKNIAVGSKDVYASTGSSILVYNKEFEETRKLSTVNGLTETGISTIEWSEEYNVLVIAYATTNIDLVKGSQVINIPDISRKYIPGKKTINRIRIHERYAYLACSFGIVVVDLIKNEIKDTWRPGDGEDDAEVWDVSFGNGLVYAATGMGMFFADPADPGLAYFGNWELLGELPDPHAKYNLAMYSGSKLYVNCTGQYYPGDSIYVISSGCSLFQYTSGVFNSSFDVSEKGFVITSNGFATVYSSNGSWQKTISVYGWGNPGIIQAIEDEGNIWIADINEGIVKGSGMTEFSKITLPGPVSNYGTSVTSFNGKTIICGGGMDVTWNNLWRTMQVSVYDNNEWTPLTSSIIFDPIRAVIDPADINHYFVATWGTGLLEFRNNILVNQFTDANSPLQTIIRDKPYVRICGMAFDSNGNLWITQTEVPNTVKILKPDGTWIENPITASVPEIGDILITQTGKKWIVLPRGNGIMVLDDNNTPEYFDDDHYNEMLVTDSEGKVISYVYCLAEDLDGNIWVGTDQGPLIYYNPDRVFEPGFKAFRIKIPRNDGSGLADYMLGTEAITSIAVDGANRKWLGTMSSGAYLLSPDGTTQIRNHNEENSPLFSNTIASVSVDNKTGDIWFVTSKGLISVRGDASEGQQEFKNVYAFPNPVREDFIGNVTITGLMRDTQIRITDISGNLVYSTVSDGGMATWNLTTYNGRRVATGVYLAFCASADGTQSCITKILVIN
jgi:hypothetical protein